jgi:hypothetical protein
VLKLEIMSDTLVISSSLATAKADPERLFRDVEAGHIVRLSEGYTFARSSIVRPVDEEIARLFDEEDEAADMVSLRSDLTGVDNTIFVSTRGYAQHAPRIKIAVDPPDTFNATSKSASMAIHDYGLSGAYLAPHLVEQAKQFIERNHDALIDYWDFKIDTDQLFSRLKPPL